MKGIAKDRFWAKVEKSNNGCWLWLKSHTPKGYGLFWDSTRLVYAHRFSYQQFYGVIPDGLQIDHLCRNSPCVNPNHMELVTNKGNVLRGLSPQLARQRQTSKTHCPQGHPYNKENTKIKYRNGHYERTCRLCAREYQREYNTRVRK